MQKTNFLRIRVSDKEKEKIMKYCKKNGTNISALVRYLLFTTINKEENE